MQKTCLKLKKKKKKKKKKKPIYPSHHPQEKKSRKWKLKQDIVSMIKIFFNWKINL